MSKTTLPLVSTLLCTLALAPAACEGPPRPPEPIAPAASALEAGACPAPMDPTQPTCDQVSATGAGGLVGPMAICSTQQPWCRHADGTPFYDPINLTANGADMCTAGSGVVDPKLWYHDPVLGLDRYACLYTPPAAHRTPKPLLIFFPGSEVDVSTMYSLTNLHQDAVAQGFVLAGLQAFNTHLFGCGLPDGQHMDYFFRDFSPGGCNHDVRFVDWLIDDLVASGTVDPSRIFVSGWSNGAFFAQAYAISRFTATTPGQSHVAAAAVYAGADPYADMENTGCGQAQTYPLSAVPIQIVHRSCDGGVPCDAAYDVPVGCDGGLGRTCNGTPSDVTDWLATLATRVGDPQAYNVTIDTTGGFVNPPACLGAADSCNVCTPALGLANHADWPTTWESEMLSFLMEHPHP